MFTGRCLVVHARTWISAALLIGFGGVAIPAYGETINYTVTFAGAGQVGPTWTFAYDAASFRDADVPLRDSDLAGFSSVPVAGQPFFFQSAEDDFVVVDESGRVKALYADAEPVAGAVPMLQLNVDYSYQIVDAEGEIAADGVYSVVPEPSAITLLALGVFGCTLFPLAVERKGPSVRSVNR